MAHGVLETEVGLQSAGRGLEDTQPRNDQNQRISEPLEGQQNCRFAAVT